MRPATLVDLTPTNCVRLRVALQGTQHDTGSCKCQCKYCTGHSLARSLAKALACDALNCTPCRCVVGVSRRGEACAHQQL